MSEHVREFLVPDLGEGLEEATIVQWNVRSGDVVELNDVICVVETAKAEVDIPSPFAGQVVQRGGDEGDTLAVGSLLIQIATSPGSDTPPSSPAEAAPVDDRPPRQPTLVGYGHDESLDRSRRDRSGSMATRMATPSPSSAEGNRPLAKPPVRLLARRLGIDLHRIAPGTGPSGTVTRRDVEQAAAGFDVRGAKTTTAAEEPVRGVRARIADHMTASRSEIPDAHCSVTVDCGRLLEVRDTLNKECERRQISPVISPFSLICRSVILALAANPRMNSTYDTAGPSIRLHESVHLGIGTATDRGLVVTVVRDAADIGLRSLASEIRRLSEGARDGSLAPADMVGSTFTISNFGSLGIDEGTPIINHPEAAILGVGSVRQRPVVVDGEVIARPTATMTLAFDHRVSDGAEAGHFLSDLRALIEAPETSVLFT